MNGQCHSFRNINFLLKNEWFLKSVTEITKLVHKYKNDQLKRISAGADKKRKIKHRKLKDNYKSFKNRKEKIQDVKQTGNERDENKNKTVLPGIQGKSSDSSRKRVEGSEKKTDSRIDMTTKSETKSVRKLTKCSKNSPVKDSAEVNKFKKEKIKKNKRSKKKLAKIAEKFVETSEKNKAKQTSMKEKDVKKSDKDSENISKSERKKEMKKKGKRRRSSEEVYESEKIRDKNDVKKHRTTSKSTSKQCKMKKRKAKKVKKGNEKKNKKAEDERKLRSQRRKPEIKFLEDQGSDSSIMITKQSIPISKTENQISDDDIEEIDEKIDPIDEKRNEQERIVTMMKQPLEKIEEVKPKQNDMKRDELSRDARKIMHVFIQKKNKLHDMTMKPNQIQYEMNTMKKTNSDITQGPDSSTSPTKSESSEEREDEMKKKEVINENSPSNMTFSGTSNNDQDRNFKITDEKLERRTEYQESGQMKDSRKTEMNASPTSINIDVVQNDQNESKNRSYINGLAQIRTILEIYGMEKERTEAFNKLLDEDVPMSEKEIAENLTIAVCDLPMNAELLRKVLKKMHHSNLLSKKEYEMLQTNLVPEAVNESVTIALLVQTTAKIFLVVMHRRNGKSPLLAVHAFQQNTAFASPQIPMNEKLIISDYRIVIYSTMFPAYAQDFPSHHSAPIDEDNDFSGRFGSFASRSKKKNGNKEQQRNEYQERKTREKTKRRKEFERQQMLSHHSIKMVGINSDDESDIEVPMDIVSTRQKRKLKHSSKRKKRKKQRRRSTSSSSSFSESSDSTRDSVSSTSSENEHNRRLSVPQILCASHRWSFMTKFDPSNAKSFMTMDLKGDRSNMHYESLYKGDVAQYGFTLKKILGGDENLERFYFGTSEKKDNFQRYFSDKVRKAWKEEPERLWRRKELKPFTDYIELSRFALSEDDLKDDSGNLSLEKCNAVQGGKSLIEATPEARSRRYNAQLGNDRYNIELWLKFLAVQDEVFLAQDSLESRKKTRNERLTNRELLERKMSILDKAISLNFNCVKLKLERLKIGMHLWEENVFSREMRDVEFKHVNDPEMWKGILDLLESDTRRFNLTNQCTKMKVCLAKLDEIHSGKLLSHKALPNTEEFMASVILRKIRLLLKCGHTEKAIATAQAVCEFNLCVPESFESANLEDKRKLFETFWDSGIARIGDEDAEGWARSMKHIKEGTVKTDQSLCEEEQLEYDKKEEELCKRVGSNGLKLSYRLVWIEIERLRTQYQWRPIRDLGATFDDRERVVTFQDIEDVLYVFSPPVAFDLFCSILEEFGAVIYARDSILSANIMHEFSIFPDLSLHLRNFAKSVNRFFELASSYIEKERDLLLSSQLLTYLNFLKMDGELNEKMRLKKFRDEAKNICYKNNNVINTSLMATYAEKMYELGEKQAAKICATKFLITNMWNEVEIARTISLLRMAIVCISATDDETEKRHLIAGFICEGKFVTDTITDAKKIENRVNIRLHDLLTTNCLKETWEGSAVDLAASLTLLFAYYYADNNKRVYNLKKCYTTLSDIMKNNSQRIFTRKYLELLRMHVTNNPCEPQRLLMEASMMAHQKFPTEISFLKIYIDCCAVGTRVIHLRRFLESDVEDWHANYCLAFGSVYLELLRHRRLLEANDFQSPELHRLRTVMQKSSERICHRDDVFWRLLLFIENERKDTPRAREVFYLAYAECPWSKALIMDYKDVNAGEHEKLLDALVEKKLRLRCEHEEIGVLLR
ncbi:NRDE-2 necessary for RNA interference family protein [Acanthocheilonema viteae]